MEKEEERTPQQQFVQSIGAMLEKPTAKNMGAVRSSTDALLRTRASGSRRLVILALAKMYYHLLPSYNIHLKGYSYNNAAKDTSYEYLLVQEWSKYLKRITRTKVKESYEAAAILLPQTLLFNKSMKLIGMVVKGAGMEDGVGKKCRKVLRTIFSCDKGNRVVRILEVMNQMSLEKIPGRALKLLAHITDEVLTRPNKREILSKQDLRALTDEEKAVQREAELHFLPEKLKAWRGINERLLRIYLFLLTQRDVDKYPYVLDQIQRVHIPGNLAEGIFTVLTQQISRLKKDLTPKKVSVLAKCYTVLHRVFGEKLEFSFQYEEIERIPFEVFLHVENREALDVYSSLSAVEKKQGSPELLKLLLRRGMHRIDPNLADTVRHLMPIEGPNSLHEHTRSGFWELFLLKRRG